MEKGKKLTRAGSDFSKASAGGTETVEMATKNHFYRKGNL